MSTKSSSGSHSPASSSTTTSPPPPPPPSFIFRGHNSPVHALEFLNSNALLATADEDGWIFIWDLWRRRQITKWQAHPSDSILALKAVPYPHRNESTSAAQKSHTCGKTRKGRCQQGSWWDETGFLLSHGRDHVIHVWDLRAILLGTDRRKGSKIPTASAISKPEPVYSLPVNALNFCAMSVLVIESLQLKSAQASGSAPNSTLSSISTTYQHLYIAVPSTKDVSLIDVYDLVKPERTFAAVGRSVSSVPGGVNPLSRSDRSAAMAIRIFRTQPEIHDVDSSIGSREQRQQLHMMIGYECGTVALFREETLSAAVPVTLDSKGAPKRKMEVVWSIQCHQEPVVSLDVSKDLRYGISCGADNTLVKYMLSSPLQGVPETTKVSLRSSGGRGELRIRSDNKIVAVAGWDGNIRIFAFKSLKPLAVLKYHREALNGLALAEIKTEEVMTGDEKEKNSTAASENSFNEEADQKLEQVVEAKDVEDDANEKENDEQEEKEHESDSEEDSDHEEILASQEKWYRRHWIAAAGKEHRISLWEIY
ncbi:Guanine nucleotide binding protein (G protein), beta polypeptide 1-like [Gryganskiella cystojenkinii]|nr:Guanine nucleotide binding protein (G protein), beta polypeptide 1-like [Gryganskiella cystojenkinii]